MSFQLNTPKICNEALLSWTEFWHGLAIVCWIGLHTYRGNKRHLWSTDPAQGSPFVQSLLSRRRWEIFWRCLRADDFSDVLPADVAVRAALNPLWRVDRVCKEFFSNSVQNWRMGSCDSLTLDEMLVVHWTRSPKGTGREHSYKPGGAGCLFNALCDSKTGYLISAVSEAHGNRVKDLMADAIRSKWISEELVENLTAIRQRFLAVIYLARDLFPVRGVAPIAFLWMDNLQNNTVLQRCLQWLRIASAGTSRKNGVDVFKNVKMEVGPQRPTIVFRADVVFKRLGQEVHNTWWAVKISGTGAKKIAGFDMVCQEPEQRWGFQVANGEKAVLANGEPNMFFRPQIDVQQYYNLNKGGVDKNDQRTVSYRCWMKPHRWTLVYLLEFLNRAQVQASIVKALRLAEQNADPETTKMDRLSFLHFCEGGGFIQTENLKRQVAGLVAGNVAVPERLRRVSIQPERGRGDAVVDEEKKKFSRVSAPVMDRANQLRKTGRHYSISDSHYDAAKHNARKCKQCGKHKSMLVCDICLIPLCAQPCFKLFHEKP